MQHIGVDVPAANLIFRLVRRTPYVMHEHVNLFCAGALRVLLERCGLAVAEVGEREFDFGRLQLPVLSALARPRA